MSDLGEAYFAQSEEYEAQDYLIHWKYEAEMYMKQLRERAMYSQRIRHSAMKSMLADIKVWNAKTELELHEIYYSDLPNDSLVLRKKYVGSLKRIYVSLANVDLADDINPLEWHIAPPLTAYRYQLFIKEVDHFMAKLKRIHEFGYLRADKVQYHDMDIVELTNSSEYIYLNSIE